jgi:hypothetical protein
LRLTGIRVSWVYDVHFPSQTQLYPLNILIELTSGCTGSRLGYAEVGLPYDFSNWIRGKVKTLVYTDCRNYQIRTTAHEFAHALGLGHTWHEKDDMMCSEDHILFVINVPDTCNSPIDVYPDNEKPKLQCRRHSVHVWKRWI